MFIPSCCKCSHPVYTSALTLEGSRAEDDDAVWVYGTAPGLRECRRLFMVYILSSYFFKKKLDKIWHGPEQPEFAKEPKIILNFWPPCLYFPNSWITEACTTIYKAWKQFLTSAVRLRLLKKFLKITDRTRMGREVVLVILWEAVIHTVL